MEAHNDHIGLQLKIEHFLQKSHLFSELHEAALTELAELLTVMNLSGGEVLFRRFDHGDSLYIVMYGRLKVVIEQEHDTELLLNEVGPGEVVGEIALLIDDTRKATVKAVRDSILLKLSREDFDRFDQKYPSAMMGVARFCVKRLVEHVPTNKEKIINLNLTVIPAANSGSYRAFADRLVTTLAEDGLSYLINRDCLHRVFGDKSIAMIEEGKDNEQLLAWIHDLESTYKYLVYEADSEMNSWTRRCLRQADRILLVCQADENPALGTIEKQLFLNPIKHIAGRKELIVLHQDYQQAPRDSHLWLKQRSVDDWHHVPSNSPSALQRVARLITGRGLGLVLSGGGASALVQVGVLRALEEKKINIDYIGGSSMGGLIAGLYALHGTYQGVVDALLKLYELFRHGLDLTLPLTSFISGRKLTDVLQETFTPDSFIEDLWLKFFCISSNITTGKVRVHQDNLLWRSIRASVSLPAIFPPILDDASPALLVDGGIINNLPVDVMHSKINGGKVLALNLLSPVQNSNYTIESEYVSGWRQLFQRLFIKEKRTSRTPTIAEIITASMLVGSNRYQQEMAEAADYCLDLSAGAVGLLNFKAYPQLFERGYQTALQELDKLKLS